MRSLLYLHGFASSPRGRKLALLQAALEPHGWRIDAPDLNVPSFLHLDFDAMADAALDAASASAPAVVVGSSLGALVALEVSRRGVRAPLVLVAPAMGFGTRWPDRLPPGDPLEFFHHGVGAMLPVHRAFFDRMTGREPDRDPPRDAVSIVMGRADETVPYSIVEDTWRRWRATGRLADGSELVSIEDGDHGLADHVPVIARAVLRRAGVSAG